MLLESCIVIMMFLVQGLIIHQAKDQVPSKGLLSHLEGLNPKMTLDRLKINQALGHTMTHILIISQGRCGLLGPNEKKNSGQVLALAVITTHKVGLVVTRGIK